MISECVLKVNKMLSSVASNPDIPEDNEKFKPWYEKQVEENRNDWDFKNEMIKYCRADVELLSKSVLAFRKG